MRSGAAPWRTTRPDPRRLAGRTSSNATSLPAGQTSSGSPTSPTCAAGRLVFFAFVLDAYSRMIVGWQLATHMRTDLVLDALRMALIAAGPEPTSS